MDPLEAAFVTALDQHPDDWTTRLAYADWLEEQGRESDQMLQRWLVARGKWPRLILIQYGPLSQARSWEWLDGSLAPEHSSHAYLPGDVYLLMEAALGTSSFGYRDKALGADEYSERVLFFETRASAEQALGRVLFGAISSGLTGPREASA